MRIAIVTGVVPGPQDAVLVQDGFEAPESGYVMSFSLGLPGHMAGCACCAPRAPVAQALARLWRARATGTAPFFSRVVLLASPAGEDAVRAAMAGDALAQARYELQA